MNDAVQGGCLCSWTRYRITGAPLAQSICHCRSCRLAGGSPSVAWIVVRAADFTFVSGEPRAVARVDAPTSTRLIAI
jgi:hypothetical protein